VNRRGIGLTRRGWTVAGAAAGLLVGGRLLGADELSVLGLCGLVVLVLAVAWTLAARPALTVRRRTEPARLHVGDAARVDLEAAATRATPLLDLREEIDDGRLRARFLLAPLRGGDETEVAYRLPTDRRGALLLGPTTVVRSDPLGLAHRRREVAGADTVLVRPRVHSIAPPALGGGRRHHADDTETPRAPAGDAGGEFLAVRPYEIGDDPRRVHWRSSARSDELMVRQYVAPRRGHTLVVLDTRSGPSGGPPTDAAFERAVEAAASVVAALVRARRPFECITSGGTVLAGVGTDPRHVFDRLATVMMDEDDLLDALARNRHPQGPELVVLISARADQHVGTARRLLARQAPSLLVVTGGEVAGSGRERAGVGPLVDARRVAFADAWRLAHPAHRTGPASATPPLTVVR
jgi:uncharacterized protein (DUF58 family)